MKVMGMIERLQEIQELDGNLEIVVAGYIPLAGARIDLGSLTVRHEVGFYGGKKVLEMHVTEPYTCP